MGCRWTPWDAAGDRRTPLVQCRSPKNAKRILDDLHWTAPLDTVGHRGTSWDTVGHHWFSVDLQMPRKVFWMIYTGLQRGTPLVQCGSPNAVKRILDDLHWTAPLDTVGHRGTPWDIVGHRGHRWTPWDTVGHRGTPLDTVGYVLSLKSILSPFCIMVLI